MRGTSFLIVFTFLLATAARADEDVVTAPVQVRGARPPADESAQNENAARALEEPGFTTVVEVSRHAGETLSIAEALAETVGVSVRSLGGLGAFASISMRGAPAGQTEILVDGVPLGRVAFSSVDVGSLELASFDRVEVLRGGVPAELGGSVLGGAVSFVTRLGPAADGAHTQLTLGGGSFGARRVRVARGDEEGGIKTTLSAGYAGAEGDFDYFDDNGTPLNRADDSVHARSNNGYDSLDLCARAGGGERTRASGGVRLSWKGQGVPGPATARTVSADLATTRILADAAVKRLGLGSAGGLALGARGFAILERQRFRDPDAEIALTMADTVFTTGGGGLALTADWLASKRHRLTATIDGRLELLDRDDARASDPGASGRRLGAGGSVADEIVLGADEQIVLIPALRLDVLTTRGEGAASTTFGDEGLLPRDDVYFSPRLAGRWRLASAVTAKLDAGRYFRPPTVIELFGDRGFVAGNPNLAPEVGVTADAGFIIAPERALGPVDHVYLEAAAFGSLVDDLIAFLPTAGRFARARNVASARLGGVETAFAARALRTVTLTGNYTFLESEQRSDQVAIDGKRLPGRPRHELYLRLDAARRLGETAITAGGFVDVTLVSGNFLDEGNLNEVPARRFLGAGLRLAPTPGLTLVAEVKNLLDQQQEDVGRTGQKVPRAVADVLDYPLPGRAFYFTCDWSF